MPRTSEVYTLLSRASWFSWFLAGFQTATFDKRSTFFWRSGPKFDVSNSCPLLGGGCQEQADSHAKPSSLCRGLRRLSVFRRICVVLCGFLPYYPPALYVLCCCRLLLACQASLPVMSSGKREAGVGVPQNETHSLAIFLA